jgi:acyl-CoA synthetase (AMP-forming)/AMP-acid ligase II
MPAHFDSTLRAWARSDPGRAAIREPVRRRRFLGKASARPQWHGITFAALDQLADRYASRLERAGVRDGDRALYLLRPSIQGYAAFYGLLRIGAVPVFIDPRMPRPRLLACVADAAPRVLVGVPSAHILRLLARQAFAATEIGLTSGAGRLSALRLAGDLAEPRVQESGGADPAATCYVAYTSGSTGTAKGVPYTHGMVRAQMAVVHEVCGWRAGMPVVMCFAPFVPYALGDGLTTILPAMDFSRPAAASPARVVEAILDHDAPCAFASPAIWRTVAAWCAQGHSALRSLRSAVTVGAPVAPGLHRQLTPFLHPAGRLYTPYGATEAMPVTTVHTGTLAATWAQARAGYGTCVGHAVTGVEVRVIRVTDAPLPEWSDDLEVPAGTVGEVVVGGDIVSASYAGRPRENAISKIRSGGRVWHRTGDLGRRDADGLLWFCGRKSQRVETAHGLLPADAVENVFNEHPLVVRSALVGLGPPGGHTPVLCVELQRKVRLTPALTVELADLADATPYHGVVTDFLQHPGLPVDARHNAKILREELARWATRRWRERVRP